MVGEFFEDLFSPISKEPDLNSGTKFDVKFYQNNQVRECKITVDESNLIIFDPNRILVKLTFK